VSHGRNVLFIVLDDLRPQLACYGQDQIISPNFERLAAEGVVFERAYCQEALCAPSRASVLTGCRPDTTRIYALDTPVRKAMPEVLTLPEHFKNHGYTTVSVGKVYHHPGDDPQGWSEEPWHPTDAFPGYQTEEAKKLHERRRGEAIHLRYGLNGPPVEAGDLPDEQYADGQTTERAIRELRRLRDRPFFLAVGLVKPHLAFACPRRYWDLYRRDEIDPADNPFRPKGCPDIALHDWGELRHYYGMPKEGPLSDEQARELIHGYYACVSFVDALIGRMLDELERLGLRENTVVVAWGDHGWNLGEHGLWCKHCNFETSLHSPLIVSAPGAGTQGAHTMALTEFVDIYPSLCELCGLPLPGHLEGTSFVPVLENPDRPWKKAVFSQYPRHTDIMGYSMKTPECRYTEWRRPGERPVARELYDHRADRTENVNEADLADSRKRVEQLSRQLAAGWQAAIPPPDAG